MKKDLINRECPVCGKNELDNGTQDVCECDDEETTPEGDETHAGTYWTDEYW